MTDLNYKEQQESYLDENKIYESKYWKTVSWNIRWWAIFDTYNWKIYLDEISKIIWLGFNWEILWEESNNIKKIWIWNIVKSIIEEEKYENIDEFIKEINIAYSFKLDKILLNPIEFQKKYYNFWQ